MTNDQMSDNRLTKRRRPITIIIGLLLMVAVVIAPIALAPQIVGVTFYPGPQNNAAENRAIAFVLAELQSYIDALLLLPIVALIWFRFGWARYMFAVMILLGIAENAVSLDIFHPEVFALTLASILSVGLLFAPSSNLWLKDKQND
jgi:energy-coupling factor transporter transmembrane protein EcfT